ncbi:Holliday junction branch migration protein RuvA [Latilactobacillus graminis]|uniref:Holliday junction branch migration complex subunit RuvA n=2 Tax=Latilactobacillus graminis TaxID=60519 RepID=A0AA89L5C9_9LACO|nr:Holliday junction branch migration protein RuvA [Latilactobacillus graminis]KRM24387.1 holliday junction DNA helicase RuvA [Latilactobacillus graminis DSM 20719]QFP80062.1 Holliday junction branch migration protein RuvA [Latilactobacillus graminis]
MYEYLKGLITAVNPFYVVLEVQGIGYQLQVANPYRYVESTTDIVQIYVYQAVRDTDITLFGFYDLDEKQIFQKLISVSGIGPKSALAILANSDHSGLIQAIMTDDVSYLTKFPGVGKKTAQQIILDLKGKLDDLEQSDHLAGQTAIDLGTTGQSPELNDALAALTALGYSAREVKAITKSLTDFSAQTTDQYLREGLRLLMKK